MGRERGERAPRDGVLAEQALMTAAVLCRQDLHHRALRRGHLHRGLPRRLRPQAERHLARWQAGPSADRTLLHSCSRRGGSTRAHTYTPTHVQTDTAGQERFRTLTSSYYRNADAIIVCYAVDDKTTFENIEGHVTEATRYSTRSEKFLVANKQDVDDHVVSDEEGAELAAKLHVSFHKTSAKSGDGVEDLFMQVARKLMAYVAAHSARVYCAGVLARLRPRPWPCSHASRFSWSQIWHCHCQHGRTRRSHCQTQQDQGQLNPMSDISASAAATPCS